MAGRKWTLDETATVRSLYGAKPVSEIAKMIGRIMGAVYQKADLLGLATPRRSEVEHAAFSNHVRTCHAKKLSDSETATAWNASVIRKQNGWGRCCRKAIGNERNRLGLPANGWTERKLAAIREKTQEQLRRDNCQCLVDYQMRQRRREATRHGWPGYMSPVEIAVLDLMADGVARTRHEMAEAIYGRWKGKRTFTSRRSGGSVTAWLMRQGYLVRSGRRCRQGDGRGDHRYEYVMPLTIVMNHRHQRRHSLAG